MIRAVIYARYSSSNQREESIEGQLRICKSFAENMGLTITDEYIDRALSAKTDNRPDFQRMIADSKKHLFDAVILYSVDRFARSRYDSAYYKMLLKKNGVKLYYAQNTIPDSPEGIILESVMEGYAEYYSVELSTKIKRGLMENVLNGKVAGSQCPFGYIRTSNGKYVADPAHSDTVREIFMLYADGYSCADIARKLNERGICTSKGAKWNKNSFHTLLTNRKYLGEYVYENVNVPDAIEPIISQELFDKVQSKLKIVCKTKAHKKASEEYLLSGKLFCGHCGKPMVGESGTSKTGTIHHYYKCVGRKVDHTCTKAVERKEPLEEIIVKTTVQNILTDEIIEKIAEKAYNMMIKESENNSVLLSLQSRLSEVKKSLSNILKAIEAGIFTDTTKDRLITLEHEKNDLTVQIEKERIGHPILPKERIMFWLESFRNGDVSDETYRRHIIDTLVYRVYVYDNDDGKKTLKIVYNLSENNEIQISMGSDFGTDTPPLTSLSNPILYRLGNSWVFCIVIRAD